MSTQIEEGNKEGVKDPDDNLIDFLIDDVHFDDLVLEKDVADVDQIELFWNYYAKHVDKAKFKDFRRALLFRLLNILTAVFLCMGYRFSGVLWLLTHLTRNII